MTSVSELESNLDIPAVLELWGVDTYDLHQTSVNEWRSTCFIHSGDNDSSLSIRFRNGRYWVACYSHNCFSGTLVDYAMQYTNRTFRQVIDDYGGCQASACETKRPYRNYRPSASNLNTTLSDDVMEQFEPLIHGDLIRLGYDRNVLRSVFDVRYCNDPNHQLFQRIVYPVRTKTGVHVTVQGRIIQALESKRPKYQFLHGLSVKHVPYGAYENRQRIRSSPYVVVGEGAKIVWRGWQLGFPAVALLGIRWTETQMRALAALGKRLILVADNDEPGIDGMNDLANELQRYVRVDMRIVPDAGKDLSDYCTRDEWIKILGVWS